MSELSSVISGLMKKGIIVDKEALNFIEENNISQDEIESMKINSLILTKEILEMQLKRETGKTESINTQNETRDEGIRNEEIQDTKTEEQTDRTHHQSITARDIKHSVIIEQMNCFDPAEKKLDSFVEYFNSRYNTLKNLLSNRQELKNLVSIGRFNKFSNERNVSVIGIVSNISKSKNDNTILNIEDPTGRINVLIKDQKDAGETNILNDEVIGITGSISKGFMFADSIVLPDIPLNRPIKRIKDTVSAVFLSDLHFGSKYFNKGIEDRFIKWIKSKDASDVKYVLICGDNVDGVGIYPKQDRELIVKDIHGQYALFEEFVMKIPGHMQIIICAGNHDAVRLGEPQPIIPKDLVPRLYDLENVHLTTNPSCVNIHAIDSEGINVLMYHGYSFTSVIDAVPYLRKKGLQNPQHVMKYVLKRRHLAPTYGATIAVPEKKDTLVITKIPDIFLSGDLHSHAIDNYKGITLISASTFQDQTPFMDRVGHIANPGKVSIVNLHTRETKCIDFSTE